MQLSIKWLFLIFNIVNIQKKSNFINNSED